MNEENHIKKIYCEIYHDNFENSRQYNLPRAQLILTDIPYNVGANAYGSNPNWYVNGEMGNGADPKKANKPFFSTDENFNVVNFFRFCSRLLRPEPKNAEEGKSPCLIVFCSFEQMHFMAETAKEYGFKRSIPLFFVKDHSAQALKANMRVVGAMEFAVLLYRDKLPKFNNGGKMVFNWFQFPRERETRIHPTQKPVELMERLIEIFTDEFDTVIDPCAGSGSVLVASKNMNRNSYGFEIVGDYFEKAKNRIERQQPTLFNFDKTPEKPKNETR